ncbi:MAG: CBS domain-containing protein [Gammaproteobacteria bacterium]|nr:CBS domain-containing protein [Gammaproteobacteria bacterium]
MRRIVAVALGTVISWPDIQPLGYHYILAPIALNVVLIVIMGVLLTRLLTKRHYPMQHTGSNKTSLSTITTQWAMGPAQFTDSDLHEALGKMDSYVDVAEEDLAKIYALAVMNASKRRLGYVYCKDIMKESPLTFLYGEPIENAWQQMFDNNLKAATIVDSFMRPIGIVTTTDFMHHASKEDGKNLSEKFARLISSHHKDNPRKPEVVGQIMSADPVTANLDQHIVDLVPSFTEKGFHHMPVVNDRGKLVGMITRSDLMRSMVLTRS